MKYEISNLRYEVNPINGEDVVLFRFHIHYSEPEQFTVENYFLHFHTLTKYLEQHHPDFYNYLKRVHQSLDRWGTCEALLLEALGEEALHQLNGYAIEYLMQSESIERMAMEHKTFRMNRDVEPYEKKSREIGNFISKISRVENPYYRFCETVEKQIRQTALETFPEITDFDSEAYGELKYLFVRQIQAMYADLEKLIIKYSKKGPLAV